MLSRFFIDRPIFAAVISVFFVLAGLAAMRSLPIAQYPEIAPPVVTVQAVYPGASAQTLEETVAAPLENAINGVQGMIYMSSHSTANGVTQIAVTFEIGTNVDDAAINVNNRVKQVEPRLPLEVRRQGVSVERGSSSFLQVLAFYSPDGRYDDLFTSNYVTLNVLDDLKRLPGTTNVQIFGAKDYAMRIWLKPDRLAQLKLTPADVANAINEQNAQFAAGKVGQSPIGGKQDLVYTITTRGRLADPKEFGQIIVRADPDGSTVRLADVARVELGSKDYDFIGRYNGHEATLVGIFLSPGANALEVAKTVRNRAGALAQKFPEGLDVRDPVRHDALRRGVDHRGREDARRGDAARLPRRLPVPAELARRGDPVHRGAGFADRDVCRPLHARLLDQHADALRHGARDRHRRRRRDRRAGKRRAQHARGEACAARGRGQGDARGDGPDHRDRADAVRGVRADRVSRRSHRRALPAVRRDDLDLGRHLGARRADAVAGAVRADAEARPSAAGSLLHLVQRLLRARDPPLFGRRALADPARFRRTRAVRWNGRHHRRAVEVDAGESRPRRGPGFLHRRRVPARRRDARAHRQGREAGRRADPRQQGEPGHRVVHRIRFHRRRLPQQRRDAVRRPGAVGEAQGDRGEPRRRALRQDDGNQGSARARVQSAGDLRSRRDGRVRVLHPEPRRGRRQAAL